MPAHLVVETEHLVDEDERGPRPLPRRNRPVDREVADGRHACRWRGHDRGAPTTSDAEPENETKDIDMALILPDDIGPRPRNGVSGGCTQELSEKSHAGLRGSAREEN